MRAPDLAGPAQFAVGMLYLVTGLLHLTWPAPFLSITPDWVPWPEAVVAATGMAEILGAIGLQFERTRKPAGLLLALYAVCVWPANFKHATEAIDVFGFPSSWWYHGPRLALQPLIVGAALFAGGWFRKRGTPAHLAQG